MHWKRCFFYPVFDFVLCTTFALFQSLPLLFTRLVVHIESFVLVSNCSVSRSCCTRADLKAKPQWNGRRGTLVGAFDTKAGRYTVQVQDAFAEYQTTRCRNVLSSNGMHWLFLSFRFLFFFPCIICSVWSALKEMPKKASSCLIRCLCWFLFAH